MNIREAMESENYEAAIQIIDDAFHQSPDDDAASFYFASIMLHTEHPGPARFILKRLVEKHPGKWQGWMNLGLAHKELDEHDEALACLHRAQELCPEHQGIASNLAGAYVMARKWQDGLKWADRSLAMGADLQSEISKAFAWLHQGEFAKGWDAYAKGVGHMQWRDRRDYGIPHYDGEADARVLIYGEQGVGDQIAFMSALPDGIDQGLQVAAINCYPKLRALFADTFPDLDVYGDQFVDSPAWVAKSGATHAMPMSWLQQKYRRTKESYTGAPYLKTNPAKELQWRALLKEVSDRPKVGLSWTGGKRGAHSWRQKSMELEELKGLLQIDVDWICLEYHDRSEDIAWMHRENGILIREWPWSTRTDDYSDTAALVANLDALVTVPTSVNHLAGALGKEVHCLVHDGAHFHYGAGMPYYSTVNLYRRDEMERVKAAISELVPKIRLAL